MSDSNVWDSLQKRKHLPLFYFSQTFLYLKIEFYNNFFFKKNSLPEITASIGTYWCIDRSPLSLESRTRKQEEIWSSQGKGGTAAAAKQPRPIFDWNQGFWGLV